MSLLHRRRGFRDRPDSLFRPHERLRGLPFNRMIPNILTLLALCAGLTAIRFALQEQWKLAVVAVFVAAVLDGLDGRIARILKGSSKFGAELDSLSDFVSFGVAPALVLYLWNLNNLDGAGWVLALLFSVCCALRLARFNTAIEEPDRPAWIADYFTGVPSPAGAGLVLLPMILSFQFDIALFASPWLSGAVVIGVASLLVSRLPTFAFKKVRIPPHWVLPTMLLVGFYAAFFASAPWLALSLSLIAYLATIPLSVRTYRQTQQRQAAAVAAHAQPPAQPAADPNAARPPLH